MEFIRIKCKGCLNSFRQPDFHTYHKTLSLPPKTTVAGMLGSALGISPKEVNDEWLKKDRFKMGIVGKSNGKASDLWRIDKIKNYSKNDENNAEFRKIGNKSYFKAVIVRELLYGSDYLIYLSFANKEDNNLIFEKLNYPQWALSLGREDELIRIIEIKIIQLNEREDIGSNNTILPFDINTDGYTISLNGLPEGNLLDEAPKIVKLPVTFSHKVNSDVREADSFQLFSFISNLPIKPAINRGYYDPEESCAFQIF